jgi:hypothetical protein
MRQRTGIGLAILALAFTTSIVGCGSSTYVPPEPDVELAMEIRAGGGSSQTSTAQASTGTGWGSLKGQFIYDGDPPAPKSIPTGGKDAPTCHPNSVKDDSLLVNEDNRGISNVVIFARKVSRIHESYEEQAEEARDFDQKECLFTSHVLAMRVSQTFHIKNSDAVAHNTNFSPPGDVSSNQLIAPGDDQDHKFNKQQSTPVGVTCSIHSWMKAYVLPRDDPYFAVADKNGAFELKNLPAGEEIEFQVWHERGTGNQGALIVPGLTDNRGRFTITIPADGETDQGALKLPPKAFN